MKKQYDPIKTEKNIQKFWERKKVFEFDRKSNKPTFSIDTPPPFTSGIPHMGHALWWTWNDVVARFKRMRGFNVLLPQGWDCHGLPTELQVEKNFNIKKTNRRKFLKACRLWTVDSIDKMKTKMIEMGYSADWNFEYFTNTDEYIAFVQKTLLNLFYRGLLKRVEHPVMWCTRCETTLAKAEVGYVETDGVLYYIRIAVEDDHLIIATTRPEMLPACVAIFIHPKDRRYKKFVGKKAKLPLYKREVPILENNEVDMKFGTGVVYLCTYGDEADIKWQKKFKLPAINIITEDGKLNENAGFLKGLSILDAREKIVEKLGASGFMEKEEEYKHNILCHTERGSCREPIEFLPKKQWAIEAMKFSKDILEASKNIEWYPPFMEKRLKNWVESMDWDWIISRQRVYGTPIPFWYCEKCGQIFAPKEKNLPVNPSIDKFKKKSCDCGGRIMGETDICDGWVDSTISPLIVSGYWKNDEKLHKKLYPNDLRQQGHDIIRTWAYYTILRCLLETREKPWKKILINGMVLGPDGREMHKSWGNYIVPDEVLKKQGADTIRAGLIMMGVYGNDAPFSWKDMDFTYRFLTKLWNIFRFSEKHIKNVKKSKPTLIDSWILTKLQEVEEVVAESYENFNFSKAFDTLHNFVWHAIADNYLEMIKYRIYENKNKGPAVYTLSKVLKNSIKMLAPIVPHITEEIWQNFYKGEAVSILKSSWPEKEKKNKKAEEIGDMTVSIIAFLRQYKNKRGMALNAELEKLIIECDSVLEKKIKKAFDDIKGTMKVKKIEFGRADTPIEEFPIKLSVVLSSE